MSPASSRPIALSVRGLSKTYGDLQVLGPVDLDVARGTIHCLLGGNGSGKSTAIKVLAGIVPADRGGTVVCGNASIAASNLNPQRARELGMHFVHQEPGVFLDMSVADNIAADAPYPRRFASVNSKLIRRQATDALARFDVFIDPRAEMSALSASHRTLVAIARALKDVDQDQHSVLVLDEPTASLPGSEVAELLEVLRGLADAGQAIVYVTHHLDEVVGIADECTVLRDGLVAARVPKGDISREVLVEAIVGKELYELNSGARNFTAGARRLLIKDLRTARIGPINLVAGGGEIVGIAGLLQSGRSSLLRTLFGLHKYSGAYTFDGEEIAPSHTAQAMQLGIAFVPEDRSGEGAFLDQSVADNLCAGSPHSRFAYISPRGIARLGAKDIATYGVKASSPQQVMARLSGGNQQKVVLARVLRASPRLLLLDEPSQGVDVGARMQIHDLIREHCRQTGAVALVASSSDEELAILCDRVLVMHDGRIELEIADELSPQRIARAVLNTPDLSSHGDSDG